MSAIRNHLWNQYQRARQSVRERPFGAARTREMPRLPPVSSFQRESRAPTILVHGYRDNATVFQPLQKYLYEIGLESDAVTLAPSDCSVPLETLAEQLRAYIDSKYSRVQALNFVGFSLGGIVARYYLQRMGGLARASRFLAVATPHYGTWIAYASNLPGAMQLQPNSSFLHDLNSDADQLASILLRSIWTPLDSMIIPSFNCRLPFGENMAVWTLRHQGLITGRRGIQLIAEQLFDVNSSVEAPVQTQLRRNTAMNP